jgi:hypothetical protein
LIARAACRETCGVTLILGMSKSEGIYLSVDYRISNKNTREVIDDATEKFLTVQYPPIRNPPQPNGPQALTAYTGAAFARGQTPMGDWLLETLRGEVEVFDDSMRHLGNRLNRDLAAYFHLHKMPLIIVAVVIHDGLRAVGGYSNMEPDGTILRKFEYHMNEITEPGVFGSGAGAPRVETDHLDLLREQLNVRPRNPRDHMKLLATVNRKVAAVEKSVSPHCHVSFINADDRFEPRSETFADPGTPLPFRMRTLFGGLDLSLFDHLRHDLEAGKKSDVDEINKYVKRRP